MTIFGNAAKWALLMPLCVAAVSLGVGLAALSGWGLASVFTDNSTVKMFAAFVTASMGVGAFLGARDAARS
jgi:hypothetical protein